MHKLIIALAFLAVSAGVNAGTTLMVDGSGVCAQSVNFTATTVQRSGVAILSAEADTLATVTGRGATSEQSLTLTGATPLTLGADAATNTAGWAKFWSAGATDYWTVIQAATQTANLTITLPAAPPASTYLLTMTAAGVMGYDSSTYQTAVIGNATGNLVQRSNTNTIATDVITEIDSGDGVTIDSVLCKDGTITGLLTVTPHTSTGNITAAECKGGAVTNTGAGGAVVLTLPAAVVGYSVCVFLTAAYDVDVNPDGTDQIMTLTDAAGDAISSDATVGSYVVLTCLASGKWFALGYAGTWSDAN
jgi:hypothetical protein